VCVSALGSVNIWPGDEVKAQMCVCHHLAAQSKGAKRNEHKKKPPSFIRFRFSNRNGFLTSCDLCVCVFGIIIIWVVSENISTWCSTWSADLYWLGLFQMDISSLTSDYVMFVCPSYIDAFVILDDLSIWHKFDLDTTPVRKRLRRKSRENFAHYDNMATEVDIYVISKDFLLMQSEIFWKAI
jgi:hypothetical protein